MRFITKTFLKMFKSFFKSFFIGKKRQDNTDTEFLSLGEKDGRNINKLSRHLSEHYCPIF